MSRRLPAAATLLAAALLALPACDKKAKETVPDSSPPPGPPKPGDPRLPTPGGGAPTQPLDPTLPLPPFPLPYLGVGNAATRQTSSNNLKMIALALHATHDVSGAFPGGIADKGGKPGLSWRVAILPYLEQDGLYKQFKLDEPWDSENNKRLITQMPKVYAPDRSGSTNGYTFYRSFAGPGTILHTSQPGQPGKPLPASRFSSVVDGTSNTFMVAEAYEPTVWTKPDDLPFTPGKPPRLGGGVFGNGFHVAFCDGSVRFLPLNLDATTLSNAIQINDGNVVNFP